MSFAQLLAKQTADARSQRFGEATDKLNRWLTVQLARFQQICHTASKNGADSARCSISEVDLQGFSLQEVCDKLKHKLSSLGLAELSVLCSMGVVTLHASWAGVKPTPEDQARDMPRKRKKPSGGMSRTCKICEDMQPMVVLSPCGHVLCEDCNLGRDGDRCPFCRRPVCCASDGLFID